MTVLRCSGFDGLVSTSGSNLVNELAAKGFFMTISGSALGGFTRVLGRNNIGYGLKFVAVAENNVIIFNNIDNYMQQGCIGIAARAPNNTRNGLIFGLTDLDGIVLDLKTSSASTVTLTYNPAGTTNDIAQVISIPAGVINYNYYELRWTASVIEFAVNNVVVYTKAQTSQQSFGLIFSGSRNFDIWETEIDDFYIADDANFRGDNYSRVLTMTGTSSNTGTVTGAANAHSALSSFDGDTSYVSYAADGEKTLLALSDIADNPVTIHGVSICRNGRKSDTGSVTESLLLKTASEQTVGSSFAGLALVNSGRRVFVATDPHDSSAWTKAKINSMEAGVKRGV